MRDNKLLRLCWCGTKSASEVSARLLSVLLLRSLKLISKTARRTAVVAGVREVLGRIRNGGGADGR